VESFLEEPVEAGKKPRRKGMKASTLIKKEILSRVYSASVAKGKEPDWEVPSDPDEIDGLYIDELYEDIEVFNESEEFRDSFALSTEIPCPYNSYFESKSVANLIGDQWVGWTFYYGGGKHSSPEDVEWIDDAYYLDAREETRVVMVFTKREDTED